MGVVVIARDGVQSVDITEGVKTLYDHMIGTLDWGSGFLTAEDALEIIKVALTCGFLVPEEARKAFETYLSIGRGPDVVCRACGEQVHYQSYPRGETFWYHGERVNYPAIPAGPGPHDVVLWPL